MSPLELLQTELKKWESALIHLEKAFKDDAIAENVYNERKNNLTLKISVYKRAIVILLSSHYI